MNVVMVLNDGVFLFHKFVVECGFSLVGIRVFALFLWLWCGFLGFTWIWSKGVSYCVILCTSVGLMPLFFGTSFYGDCLSGHGNLCLSSG